MSKRVGCPVGMEMADNRCIPRQRKFDGKTFTYRGINTSKKIVPDAKKYWHDQGYSVRFIPQKNPKGTFSCYKTIFYLYARKK